MLIVIEVNYQALVPFVIVGIMQLGEQLAVPKWLVPFIILIVSCILSIFYLYPDDIKKAIFVGLIYTLSSMGLYSGTKLTVKGFLELSANKNK